MKLSIPAGLTGLVSLLVTSCGAIDQLNSTDQQGISEEDSNIVRIAGLFDVNGFPWSEELFEFTVRLINDHSDGWFDEVLNDGKTKLEYSISDSACDQDVTVRAYLKLTRGVTLPHAILGCRCSGPTMDMARLSAAEGIISASFSAVSPQLSKKELYPLFSRLVGPADASGQAGALVSLLRSFGWDRISIINTDRPLATEWQTELTHAWAGTHDTGPDGPFTGVVGYKGTIRIDKVTEKVDLDSVEKVLNSVPVNNAKRNSKVIVLLGHHEHTYEILKKAQTMNFQPDTIWVGMSAWAGREPIDSDTSWMPDIPGYIGIVPYRDLTAPVYQDFLGRLQEDQRRHNRPVTTDLPDSAADRLVDGVLALSMALSNVPDNQRRNGTALVTALRNLTFQGVSGLVGFNEKGDRANPRFTVLTLPKRGTEYINIGSVSPGSVDVNHSKICYAEIGCVDYKPSEKPLIDNTMEGWAIAVIALLAAMLGLGGPLLIREHYRQKTIRERLRHLEHELQNLDSKDGEVQTRKGKLYTEIAHLLGQKRPDHWTTDPMLDIPPAEKEYWTIHDRLNETMTHGEQCHISSLARVQNDGIWAYYVFRKNQLANKYGIEDLNDTETLCEASVWHGTSSLNPETIYNDNQEGFMYQFSRKGLYGMGIVSN